MTAREENSRSVPRVDEQPAPPNPPVVNPWIVALSVMFPTFMEVLDTTVVNVSLPHIAGSLSATADEATWTLTSYLVANAIVLPITGWLASYFGRKRLLLTSVVGFTVASFFCGLAPNLTLLVILRVIQGAAGGCLQPISQAVMLEAFPPARRGRAMAFWGLGIVVAPMLGPVLGGWLTDSYSWRWVFYINVPVGVLSVVMCSLFLFDPPYLRRRSEQVDYGGLGLLALGMATLQIMLDKGQEADWFSATWVREFAAISAVALGVFVLWELRTRHPVVDLRVLRVRTYATGVFLMTMLGFVLYGSTVLLPLLLQVLLGYPALNAGVAMFPRGLGSFLMMPVVGILMSWVDARKLLITGLVGVASSLLWLSRLNMQLGYWDIFWPQLLQGLSLSLVFVPLTTVTMDPIPVEEMGNATSIFNLMRNLGGSIGIAVTDTWVVRLTQQNINLLGRHVNALNPESQLRLEQLQHVFAAQGAGPVTAARQAYAVLFGMVEQQASMLSYNYVFGLLGAVFVGMIPLVWLLRRPRQGRPSAALH